MQLLAELSYDKAQGQRSDLHELGLLAGAFCVHHQRWVTFARRLARDLAERRKPPLTLVRRGLALAREEPSVIRRQEALGAEPVRLVSR